jgi:hypothetical protein
VNGNRLARLSELERLVGGIVIVAAAAKPARLMTDAEAVEEWRRLCRLPIPPPPSQTMTSARRSSRSGGN